jgi:hypothetical protein
MWTNEGTVVHGGLYNSFRHNYSYVKFWHLGSPTDAYRSIHFNCYDGDHTAGQQMHMIHTEWHYSTGFAAGGSTGYPCSHTDFKVQYMKTFNSTTGAGRGFWASWPSNTVPVKGKDRTAQYIYLDKGIDPQAGNISFGGFRVASYIVFDNQGACWGPLYTNIGTQNVDHLLFHQTVNGCSQLSFFGAMNSYILFAMDGGLKRQHSLATAGSLNNYTTVVDHLIWQYGATDASETQWVVFDGGTNSSLTVQNSLVLPSAATPKYSVSTSNTMVTSPGAAMYFNHIVLPFGNGYNCNTPTFCDSIHFGETNGGMHGLVKAVKNSIFWNPGTTAQRSPLYYYTGNGHLAVANSVDPTGVKNNAISGYAPATRWTTRQAPCTVRIPCTSNNTPYDIPTTGTVPGANDVHQTPQFVWQAQGISAPSVRDWAHLRFGAPYDSADMLGPSANVYFSEAFALFANADINDTTTTAGMKGRIDDAFSWLFAEWASTNASLKGAADDGSDIGASPVALTCPSAYPAAVMPGCNTIAALRPASAPGGSK